MTDLGTVAGTPKVENLIQRIWGIIIFEYLRQQSSLILLH